MRFEREIADRMIVDDIMQDNYDRRDYCSE